jgi:excisionase family DNA binding protein
MTMKLLLTPEQACESLGISRAMGFKLIARGELPSVKIGRCRRVPAEALAHWVKQQVAAQCSTQQEGSNRD